MIESSLAFFPLDLHFGAISIRLPSECNRDRQLSRRTDAIGRLVTFVKAIRMGVRKNASAQIYGCDRFRCPMRLVSYPDYSSMLCGVKLGISQALMRETTPVFHILV
jgi:hypothetical protein